MQLPAPFEPIGDHIGIALPGGRALFTTRRGGNPLDDAIQTRQVHGTHVVRVERRLEHIEEADGQATAAEGLALLVLVADCLPVALIGEQAVAMLHAGWRGLANGILEEGVGAVRGLGDDGPLRAAIGPGAGPCCYEVGDEVRSAFGTTARTVDLKAIAAQRLTAAGVETIHDVGLCTICSDPSLFFSYRRDGGTTGRQAGIAWRN